MDSVIALFRVDFTGRGELADRQVKTVHPYDVIIVGNFLEKSTITDSFAQFKVWYELMPVL